MLTSLNSVVKISICLAISKKSSWKLVPTYRNQAATIGMIYRFLIKAYIIYGFFLFRNFRRSQKNRTTKIRINGQLLSTWMKNSEMELKPVLTAFQIFTP